MFKQCWRHRHCTLSSKLCKSATDNAGCSARGNACAFTLQPASRHGFATRPLQGQAVDEREDAGSRAHSNCLGLKHRMVLGRQVGRQESRYRRNQVCWLIDSDGSFGEEQMCKGATGDEERGMKCKASSRITSIDRTSHKHDTTAQG